MKYLFSILLFFSCFLGKAQLFTESFGYPEGTSLSTLSWGIHSGGDANPVLVSKGLNFGNAVLNNGIELKGGGQDLSQTFAEQTKGSVYASFLVNVKETSPDGDYFFHLGAKDLGTNFRGRVFVKSNTDGIQFGVSKSSNSPNYSPEVFQKNKTYQVVLKYTFLEATNSDDVVELFVLKSETKGEPEPTVKANEGESDATGMGTLALRQGNGSKAPTLTLDEIRVASSWQYAVGLSRKMSVELMLPERLYAFRSKCEKESVFPVVLNAYWPENSLNLWSPSADVVEFSRDGISWSDQLIFTTSDNSYYEAFYIKMLSSQIEETESVFTISIDNYGAEVIDHVTARYAIFQLREDCTLPIRNAKKLQLGDSVLVSGGVTASAHEFADFNYLGDETSGIRIQGDFGFRIGDSVQFNGVLSELNQEMVLLIDSLKGAKIFNKLIIQAKKVELDELANHAGELVKVENVTLKDTNFVFLPNANESIVKNGNVVPVRIWSTTQIDGHAKPQHSFDITGVVGQYRDKFQIYPRLESDIENLGKIPEPVLNVSKEYTFDLAAWNLEWFGSTGNGPKDEALQMQNATKAMKEMDADVFVLEEITGLSAFDALVASLDNYSGVCSPEVSGGGEPDFAQRVCIVFKNETVKLVEMKALLKGTPEIVGYPENFDRFWASGRFPALFVCDVKINGITRRLNIIGIHARANRNNDEKELVYKMRMKDIEVLKDSLDLHFSLASIIMAGDFNDDVDETVVSGFSTSTYANFVGDENYKVLTKELSDKKQKSYIGYDNVIDHIMISNELFDSVLEDGTQLQFPFVNIDGYPDNTSDHLPVMSRFMLRPAKAAVGFSEIDEVLIYANSTGVDLGLGRSNSYLELQLFNSKGEVLEKTRGNVTSIEKRLNRALIKQDAGIYIIKVKVGISTKTYKIVKN